MDQRMALEICIGPLNHPIHPVAEATADSAFKCEHSFAECVAPTGQNLNKKFNSCPLASITKCQLDLI